jgi:acyl-CoA oxidase
MLPQQVIKVLLKLVGAVQSGIDAALEDYKVTDMNYLIRPLKDLMKSEDIGTLPTKSTFAFPKPNNMRSNEFMDVSTLLTAFQYRSACLLLDVAMQLKASMGTSSTAQQAWNDALLAMARASRAPATIEASSLKTILCYRLAVDSGSMCSAQ